MLKLKDEDGHNTCQVMHNHTWGEEDDLAKKGASRISTDGNNTKGTNKLHAFVTAHPRSNLSKRKEKNIPDIISRSTILASPAVPI